MMLKPLFLSVLLIILVGCETYIDPTPTRSPITDTPPTHYTPSAEPTSTGIPPLEAVQTGEGYVNDVLWAGDTALVVSQMGLWLYRPDAEPRLVGGHYNPVHVAAFNADGTLLASAEKSPLPFEPSIIRIWDLENGGIKAVIEPPTGQVEALAFSPGSALLATGGNDTVLYEWDVITGSQVRTYPIYYQTIRAIAYSPDGQWLISGGEAVQRINRRNGEVLTMPDLPAPIALAFSPNSQYAAGANAEGTVVVWEMSTGSAVAGLDYPALALTFSDDDNILLSAADESIIYTLGYQEITSVRRNVRYWSPDLSAYAIFSDDHLDLFNSDDSLRASYPYRIVTPPPVTPNALLPTPYDVAFEVRSVVTHGDWMVVVGGTGRRGEGRVQVFDTRTGESLSRYQGIHDFYVDVAVINDDGTRLLTGGVDNRVLLWSLPDLQPLGILGKLSGPILYVAFTDDGGYSVISADGTQQTGPLPN